MTEAESVLAYRLTRLEAELANEALRRERTEAAFKAALDAFEESAELRERERLDRERKNLWAGIVFLGTIITTLGGVIWAYRGVIFGGKG